MKQELEKNSVKFETIKPGCKSNKNYKEKNIKYKQHLDILEANTHKNETPSINKDTTIAESESAITKRELFKKKMINKNNGNRSQRKPYYALRNLIKTDTIRTKDLFKDFEENQSDIHIKLLTDLNPIIKNHNPSEKFKHDKNLNSNTESATNKNNKKIENEIKSKINHEIKTNNLKEPYLNSIDRKKFLNIYRHGIGQQNFNELNKKLRRRTYIKTDYNKYQYYYTYFIAPKKFNFMDGEEKSTCNPYIKIKPYDDDKLNSDKIIKKDFESISRLKEKLIYENVIKLKQEINVISPNNFRLVSSTDFSSEYQNHDDNFNIDAEIEMKLLEIQSNHSKQSNKNCLRNELIKEIQTIEKEQNEEHKKNSLHKWKKIIISAAIHFKKLNLTLEELLSHNFNCIKPYENKGSFELFQAIKHGDFISVAELIKENKFLVHDYDYFNQTALHWAAKRNRFTIIPILVSNGANINAEDISGRTPLHIAAGHSYLESVKILLYEMADPFKRDKEGKQAIEMTKDNKCIFYLSRARILHIIHTIGSVKKSQERIKFGFEFFFNSIEKEMFAKDLPKK